MNTTLVSFVFLFAICNLVASEERTWDVAKTTDASITEGSRTSTTDEIITIPDTTSSTTSASFTRVFPVSPGTSTTTTSPRTSTSLSTSPSPSSTSTSPSHPTSTAKPSTTTEANPTTPAYPDHLPTSPWNVSYDKKKDPSYCILAQFEARVIVFYENEKGDLVSTGFDIPANATADGECQAHASEQTLFLAFDPQVAGGRLTIKFASNSSMVSVDEIMVRFQLTPHLFPGLASSFHGKMATALQANIDVFKARTEHSYCCSTDSSNLTEIDVDGDGKSPQPLKYSLFQVKNVQMQAFMAANTHYAKFMDADVCGKDLQASSDTVPIVVGVVLVSLVVIVLSAYFIGKARNKTSIRFNEI